MRRDSNHNALDSLFIDPRAECLALQLGVVIRDGHFEGVAVVLLWTCSGVHAVGPADDEARPGTTPTLTRGRGRRSRVRPRPLIQRARQVRLAEAGFLFRSSWRVLKRAISCPNFKAHAARLPRGPRASDHVEPRSSWR